MNKKESLPLKSIDALYACERVFKTWYSRKNVNTNTETSTALIGEFLCSRWDSSSTGASNGHLWMRIAWWAPNKPGRAIALFSYVSVPHQPQKKITRVNIVSCVDWSGLFRLLRARVLINQLALQLELMFHSGSRTIYFPISRRRDIERFSFG